MIKEAVKVKAGAVIRRQNGQWSEISRRWNKMRVENCNKQIRLMPSTFNRQTIKNEVKIRVMLVTVL